MMPLPWIFIFINIFLCLYGGFLYISLYSFFMLGLSKSFKLTCVSLPW